MRVLMPSCPPCSSWNIILPPNKPLPLIFTLLILYFLVWSLVKNQGYTAKVDNQMAEGSCRKTFNLLNNINNYPSKLNTKMWTELKERGEKTPDMTKFTLDTKHSARATGSALHFSSSWSRSLKQMTEKSETRRERCLLFFSWFCKL